MLPTLGALVNAERRTQNVERNGHAEQVTQNAERRTGVLTHAPCTMHHSPCPLPLAPCTHIARARLTPKTPKTPKTPMNSYNPYHWHHYLPEYAVLNDEPLSLDNVEAWLMRWSRLVAAMRESDAQLYRDLSEHTTDEAIVQRYEQWVEQGVPAWERGDQALKQKFLALRGYAPNEAMQKAWQHFATEAALFREENVEIHTAITKLTTTYERKAGDLEFVWEGQSLPIEEAQRLLESTDRGQRERAWRKVMAAYASQREEFNAIFLKLLAHRRQLAANADYSDYRAFRWDEVGRFDYSPDDCATFRDAILHEVVPVAAQLYAQLGEWLAVDALRPWDTAVDPGGDPMRPFEEVAQLEETCAHIFQQVDPDFGAQFTRMRDGDLDLASRPHKAPGGYCNGFPLSGRPYIFMNAVGTNRDVTTLLHEGGHAFHFVAALDQPYVWSQDAPMEFCEVASMGMELLAAPYLTQEKGGFYDQKDARRALVEKLRDIVSFLPYMAVVDGFQHWLYAEAPEHVSAADLDAKWAELWDAYLVGVDWSGLESEKASGWHRKWHIFGAPFYYVEYGLAQLGALQLWRNAQHDQSAAVRDYRNALALGGTRSLPELFVAANLRFAFDRGHLRELMAFVTEQLERHQRL